MLDRFEYPLKTLAITEFEFVWYNDFFTDQLAGCGKKTVEGWGFGGVSAMNERRTGSGIGAGRRRYLERTRVTGWGAYYRVATRWAKWPKVGSLSGPFKVGY